MKQLVTDLTQVEELLTPREAWLKGQLATDGTNDRDPRDPGATCFCMVGAIGRATGLQANFTDPRRVEIRTALREAIQELFPERPYSIPLFNDDPLTEHADVLAVISRAKELASS